MLQIIEKPVAGYEETPSSRDRTRWGPIRSWEGYLHLRCRGRPIFLDADALDLALLLDLDPDVAEWNCLSPLRVRDGHGKLAFHVADFRVRRNDGTAYHLVVDELPDCEPVDGGAEIVVASRTGLLDETAVRNARGIMMHAGTPVPVSDQVRLLALLDGVGSVALSEAVVAMREAFDAVGAVMALAARRIVRLDCGSSEIGPRTKVERFASGGPTATADVPSELERRR